MSKLDAGGDAGIACDAKPPMSAGENKHYGGSTRLTRQSGESKKHKQMRDTNTIKTKHIKTMAYRIE